MIPIQVTITSNKGYRPMSAIIEVPDAQTFLNNKKTYQQQGIIKICTKRSMHLADLKKYGYEEVRMRVYDKEKIEREKAERYEQIKKERGWV